MPVGDEITDTGLLELCLNARQKYGVVGAQEFFHRGRQVVMPVLHRQEVGMDWRTFWNGDHSIYVNARHRAMHADLVAKGTIALLPTGRPDVLDWGCGEAEAANVVATRCGTLFLYDSAPRVRENLQRRYDAAPRIDVIDEVGLHALPEKSLDAIVIVSVVQYLSRETFNQVVSALAPKLRDGGRFIVADVIPPNLSPLVDVRALLAFAWHGGFLGAALIGLMETLFSNYSRLRGTLGLTQWDESAMISALAKHDLGARRIVQNIGHNQARMTFVAERRCNSR